jgi:hypothetical protein
MIDRSIWVVIGVEIVTALTVLDNNIHGLNR